MYLGIDLGTSGVKLVLLDDSHHLVAQAQARLSVSRPHPLWSEQDPQHWWLAVERAVAELRSHHSAALAMVRAIGLSGQMHGAVMLDARDEVLRPAILWDDGRAFEECAALERAEPNSRAITGNLAMSGFTAPKLLWLRRHEPQLFDRIRTVLLPKDWLRLQLTGEKITDMSDASGTLWLDVGHRCWSEAMLAACGLDSSYMPRLTEGSAPGGALRESLALAWGLKPGIPIAGGAGDNAASAVGVGAVKPGQGLISLGTSGVVFLAGERFQPRPEQAVHAFAHALPGRWHQMSVMLSASSALSWAVRMTGSRDEAALVAQAGELTQTQRARAPLFLPYLSGERTPHNDPQATGALVGLRSEHGPADIGYAVMEGVMFGLKDGWQAMNGGDAGGTGLALVGGGGRSDTWAQLLASGLGCRLHRHEGAHAGAAVGAARLAWLADGGKEAEVCAAPPPERVFEPDFSVEALLLPRHERYRSLYPALRTQLQS